MPVQYGHQILPNRVEMIQRAARFVYHKYQYCTVTSMLESLGWLTPEGRRSYLKLLSTYKIINPMIAIPCNDLSQLQ